MKNKLWNPFQGEGVTWLSKGSGRLLWDDAGLGKTVQAVAALGKKGVRGPVLVLCARTKLLDWETEFKKWLPSQSIQVISSKGTLRDAQIDSTLRHVDRPVILLTRESLRLVVDRLKSEHWDTIIVDEVHRVKNRSTQIFVALNSLKADHRWGLSATPIDGDIDVILKYPTTIDVSESQPKILELWAPLHWVDPEEFPSYWKFANTYATFKKTPFTRYDYQGPRWTSLEGLQEKLQPLILRRRDIDVPGQLPELVNEDWWIDLTPQEQTWYTKMEKELLVWLDKQTVVAAPTVLAQYTRLIELTAAVEIFGGPQVSSKCDAVADYIFNTPRHHKIVVASTFKGVLSSLTRRLNHPGRECPPVASGALTGETKNPSQVLKDFRDPNGPSVLLTTTATGGEGHSFSNAQTLIVIDLPWSSTQWYQLGRRVRRGDSKFSSVHLVRVLARHTIDEFLVSLHSKKRPLESTQVVRELKEYLHGVPSRDGS